MSLFCGALSVESKVKGFDKIICNDKHEYLIAMLNGVKNGYELPEVVTEADYRYIKEHKDENKVLSGFAGFACSFGGKWFGSYARCKENRNYALGGKHSLLRKIETLKNAEFICNDYRNVILPEGCVVYADPPYNGTTQYGEKFDSNEFWEYMRIISKEHIVFISEQEAPCDFICIWQKPVRRVLCCDKTKTFIATEKLFVHVINEGNINKVNRR